MDDLPAGGLLPDQQGPGARSPEAAAETAPGAEAATPPGGPNALAERSPGRIGRIGLIAGTRAPAAARGAWNSVLRWRRPGVIAALAVALVVGSSGAAPLFYNPTPTASPRSGVAVATVASSASAPSSGLGSLSPSQSPSPSPAGPSAAPPGTSSITSTPAQTSAAAAITFHNLMLDPSTDPAGAARTFTFVSDGPGVVSAQVVASSPTDSSEMCLTQDALPAKCASGATPGFVEFASGVRSQWTVTLLSANESSPTVDVAFSWPAGHPSMTATNCRFQGSPNPDSLRSLVATFKPRAAGRLTIDAAWPPVVVDATLTLTDVSGSNPTPVDEVSYVGQGSISPAYSHAVASGRTYQVSLFDDSVNSGRPHLTATITFP